MRFMVKYAACLKTGLYYLARKEVLKWQNVLIVVRQQSLAIHVSFSKRNTNRTYRPNLQKVTVIENGRKVQKTLCAKCIRTMAKTA